MSHFDHGPLATYNSLTDTHLAGYFANTRMRRHLVRSGLVSKNGVIVSEATYRLNMSRKEHKKHVKDMLAQAIVHKTLDLERSRQSEIKKKLEEIAKIQLVHRVRASRGRKGDEDILPLLTVRKSRPYSSPTSKPRQTSPNSKHRPYSAPGVRADSRISQTSAEEDEDVLYLDDEGRPINSTSHRELGSGDQIDTRHLFALDTAALRKYAMMMSQMEQRGGHASPYMMTQVPLPPRLPLSGRSPRSARRLKSVSPQRTPDGNIARLHRMESAKMHEGQQQSMCKVTMRYHGWELHLAREQMDPTQEIQVEQQHCGGNTLTVFKERLVPGSEFSFISYRHRGYPFSLTLYVDGHVDSRVSTCCEDRHSRGAKIGGKQGHFGLVRVEGAVPCYKCQVAKGVMIRNKAPRKQTKRPPQSHVEEVVVVSSTKDSSEKDKPAVKRSEGSRETQDEEKPVKVAVERDEDDKENDDAGESKKDNYEDDFEASGSSALSSSPSDSESESEATARKDRDEERPGTSGSRGEDAQPIRTRSRSRSTSPHPSPRKQNETTREASSPNQPRTRDAPKTRYRDVSADDKPRGRLEVNGTGRKIDDFSSDEDGHVDKKATILSMDEVNAEEEKSSKRSSRFSRSSSQSSSSSSSSSSSAEEEKKRPAVISVQHLDDEERGSVGRRDRDKRGQKADESLQQNQQEQGEGQSQRERQERLKEQQQQKERQMEEHRRIEELRRQREKQDERKREEARRRMEEDRTAEAQREAEGRAKREDSVTSSDDQSKEEARQKAQQQRQLEILEGQRLREEKWRAEEQARREAWRREQESRGVEKKQGETRQEGGTSSSPSTPTSSSLPKSVSVTSESEADSSPQHGARGTVVSPDGRQEHKSSVAPPANELARQPEKRKLKAEEEEKEEKEEATPGEKALSVPRTSANFMPVDDQASTAPPSSRTAGSSRSSGQDSASDSSSDDSSDSSSDSESETDNNGLDHTAEEKENVPHRTGEEVDLHRITDRGEMEIPDRRWQRTGAAAPEESEAAMPPGLAGDEEKLPADQVGEGDASPAARDETEDAESTGENSNSIPAPRLPLQVEEPPTSEPDETREADTADSSSSSSSSDSTSPSDRSSSRASSRKHGDQEAPSDDLETDRRLGALTEDRQHRDDERAPPPTVPAAPKVAKPVAEDDASRMLQPPPAAADERPSSFSSVDEDVWKPEPGREREHNSDEEFVFNGEQPALQAKLLEGARHKPETTSLEVSVREHLTGEESVELSNINLSKEQVQEVVSHLKGAEKVSAINLRNTGLQDNDLKELTAAIVTSPLEPEMLNLSRNSLTDKSVPHLLHVLKAKPSVKLLLLEGNQIGDEGVGKLMLELQGIHREARAQRKFSSDLADTVSLDSGASFATTDQSSLSRKYILRDLDLASTGITDAGAARVAEVLAGNVYIEALRLSANEEVTAEGGWARIGKGLSKNRCLRSLAVDGNRLGDAGARHLASGLHNNRTLTSLKLQNAGIGQEGGKAIMEMLKRNTTLQDLTLTPGNAIPEALMSDINNYVALNRVSGLGLPKR